MPRALRKSSRSCWASRAQPSTTRRRRRATSPPTIILFFTMITSLRFSIAGTLKTANPVLRALTHPAWLYPLVLEGGYTLGAFYHGALSPWPPASFTAVAQRFGLWGGVAAAEAASTAGGGRRGAAAAAGGGGA